MNVRFWNVNTVTPEQLALWESWLTEDKRQRLGRLPEKKRKLSLCGDALAREMLGEVLHLAPQAVTITESADGKPLTDGAFFSISHSGDVAACAVSDREVGLDMERIRPVPARLGRALEGKWQTEEEFWLLWTRREAVLKCRGGTWREWRREEVEAFSVTCPVAPDGYVAAVCEKK